MRDRVDASESRVRKVIEGAFKRRRLVLAVEHSSIALAAVFAGATLMLLLGTQILNWPWLAILTAGGITMAWWRVRSQMLSRYRVAQVIDRRLQLTDSLSTAWFLLHSPQYSSSAIAELQIRRAAETARSVRPAAVFPFVWRRAWVLTGAVAAVAFGLFALRYLVTSSLSLKQALIPLPFSSPAEVFERIENFVFKQDGTAARHVANEAKIPLRQGPRARRDEDLDRNEQPSGNPELKPNGGPGERGSPQAGAPPGEAKEGEESGSNERSPAQMQASAKDGQPPASRNGGQPQNDSSPDKEPGKGDGQHPSGLMNRMKDALSGLLAKMRPENGGRGSGDRERSPQASKPDQSAPESGSPNHAKGQNASDSQESRSQGREQGTQGPAQTQATEKSPGPQTTASDVSPNKTGSDSRAGIGRQDGDKALKEAEQLRAMGKLDEIIGERSATLTGDMTVETSSSRQQLQTQYSGRVGHHADSGGEIDRNEVPVALRKYVREYMEQVRKQANSQP